jgi:hypothetical protein
MRRVSVPRGSHRRRCAGRTTSCERPSLPDCQLESRHRRQARVGARPPLGRPLLAVALVSGGLPAVLAGCAFDSEIAVQFRPTSPAVVTESFTPEQVPHRVHGATTRRGQVVGIDCSITIVYDVNEATGLAVLVQRYVAHLRTHRLPRNHVRARLHGSADHRDPGRCIRCPGHSGDFVGAASSAPGAGSGDLGPACVRKAPAGRATHAARPRALHAHAGTPRLPRRAGLYPSGGSHDPREGDRRRLGLVRPLQVPAADPAARRPHRAGARVHDPAVREPDHLLRPAHRRRNRQPGRGEANAFLRPLGAFLRAGVRARRRARSQRRGHVLAVHAPPTSRPSPDQVLTIRGEPTKLCRSGLRRVVEREVGACAV